jgi:lipopolysaccharide transport system ATP-binding protein
MKNLAIRVNDLSKQYRIGSLQSNNETLSGLLVDMVVSPFRRAGNLLRGQSSGASDLDEMIWALKDVSFTVEHGDVVGIIGSNGAGKSTLLRILSQITEPTHGYADIYGRVGSLLEVGTGFHPELTGRENIFLNGAILGMRKSEISRKFDEIVAFSEIDKYIDTPVKHYSSGMYVRLAFSVAAYLETEILLVDEVLAVGDHAFQKKCLGKMEDVAEKGRTVLFVSHNLAMVQSLCQRGIFIEQGKISNDGSVDEAVSCYLESIERTSAQDLKRRKDRIGKGEVRLTEVKITDALNPSSEILKTGNPARFEFKLDGLKSDVFLVFVIFDHLGRRIAMFDSSNVGPSDISTSDDVEKIVCEIDQFLLLPGTYRINVLVRNRGDRQDFIEGAAYFDVEAGRVNGRPVFSNNRFNVHIPHRWLFPNQ